MSEKLPEFVMDYLEDYLGCEFKGITGRRTYKVTSEGEAVVKFFKFISQPEKRSQDTCGKGMKSRIEEFIEWLKLTSSFTSIRARQP